MSEYNDTEKNSESNELNLQEAVNELKLMFPEVSEDLIIKSLLKKDMFVQQAIQELNRKTKKFRPYDPKNVSTQSSKVYDDADEEQEEQVQSTRNKFYGGLVHKVDLLRKNQQKERQKQMHLIPEQETKDLESQEKLRLLCAVPSPDYKFSSKGQIVSSDIDQANYFYLHSVGHDAIERDQVLLKIFEDAKIKENDREIGLEAKAIILKAEIKNQENLNKLEVKKEKVDQNDQDDSDEF